MPSGRSWLRRAAGEQNQISDQALGIARQYDEEINVIIAGSGDVDPDEALRRALMHVLAERIGALSVEQTTSLAATYLEPDEIQKALLEGPVERWRRKSDIERRAIELREQALEHRRIDMADVPVGSRVNIALYDPKPLQVALDHNRQFRFSNVSPRGVLEVEALGGRSFHVFSDAMQTYASIRRGSPAIPPHAEVELYDGYVGAASAEHVTTLGFASTLTYKLNDKLLEYFIYDTGANARDSSVYPRLLIGDIFVQGVSMFDDIIINRPLHPGG